ncbi:hypothetical protein HMPREF9080_01650 [Cardiobacterium valvarum F0432]|uniref:Uncharacterized protein n=1 Tax=Cardiobacterium valvarum F0432 TaxID=797473 RepID=G9ZFX0_9GAMM|nr:hypothetical protein HMPREF9080_01650 [Cardiobacterium valvarum F0432]
MLQEFLHFFRSFADEAFVLTVEGGSEEGDALADVLAVFAEALGVEAFGARQQGAVFHLIARVDFQFRQFFVCCLQGSCIKADAAVVDGELVGAAVGGQVHVHFEQAADIVGEAHFGGHLFGIAVVRQRDADFAKVDVVAYEPRFALVDFEEQRFLVVLDGIVGFHAADGDDGVALDDGTEYAAFVVLLAGLDAGFDTERVGGHVGHDDFFQCLVLRDESRLDGGADGDGFIRVEAGGREAAKEARHCFAQDAHPRRPADEDDVIQTGGAYAGVAQGLFDGGAAAFEQRCAALFPVSTRDVPVECLTVHGELHVGVTAVQRLFGAFGGSVELPLHAGKVGLGMCTAKAPDEQFGEVFAAEHVVARTRPHFHDAAEHIKQGDVEGAAAEVKDEEFACVFALVQAVGHCGGGRFVQEAAHVQSGQFGGMAGGFALGVVEVGGDGDDGVRGACAEGGFGIGLERAKDECREFFWRELVAAAKTVTLAAAHVALEGGGSRLRVRDEAFARGGTDEDAAVIIDADHGRCEDAAEGVFDELRLAVLPAGDKAVGGAEVNAEDGGIHVCVLQAGKMARIIQRQGRRHGRREEAAVFRYRCGGVTYAAGLRRA